PPGAAGSPSAAPALRGQSPPPASRYRWAASAGDDLVLVLVEPLNALDGDLPLNPPLEDLQALRLLLLQVCRQVRVHADQHLLTRDVPDGNLDLAVDLGGEGGGGLHYAGALAGRAGLHQ